MQYPDVESYFGWDWIENECIEPNEEFDYPSCGVTLCHTIDEGAYYGNQHKLVEVVNE